MLRDPANQVSRRAITLWLLESLTWFVFVVGGSILVAYWLSGWSPIDGWPVWLLPIVVTLLMLPGVIVEPLWRFAVHRWEFSDDVVYARSGWLSREWVFVPVSRIQTVDKAQGWFERLLRLATVEIRTASHAGSSTIKGLDFTVAAQLAADLAHRARELRDDAT
ncbi:PH domain-containing protein [Streptosporangiaceae bacterium NEAU-GS5]|nr:PH domain-containing protein [Streptosporangiaceae bacterium NEAU-GS5]